MENTLEKDVMLCNEALGVQYVYTKTSGYGTGSSTNWAKNRNAFSKALRRDGYSIITQTNYIIASKNGKREVFYFTSHSAANTNYLVSANASSQITKFAFFDNESEMVFIIGYDKVAELCKTLQGKMFFNKSREIKVYVPDEWVIKNQESLFML